MQLVVLLLKKIGRKTLEILISQPTHRLLATVLHSSRLVDPPLRLLTYHFTIYQAIVLCLQVYRNPFSHQLQTQRPSMAISDQ